MDNHVLQDWLGMFIVDLVHPLIVAARADYRGLLIQGFLLEYYRLVIP